MARNLFFYILLQRFSHSVAAFATALQNISSDLITIEKQAPAGLNVLIYLYYSKLQTFLYFFIGQQWFIIINSKNKAANTPQKKMG